MTRDYSAPNFLPPSRKDREAAKVVELVDHVIAGVRGHRQVEHSRACIATLGDLDGCQGECLPFVNRWAS